LRERPKKLTGAQLHSRSKARQNGCYIKGDKKGIKQKFCEGMVILKEGRRKDNPIMFCIVTTTRERLQHKCKNHIKCIKEGGEWGKCYGCNWRRQTREEIQLRGRRRKRRR